MFKSGQLVGIQGSRKYNGSGTVRAVVDCGSDIPKRLKGFSRNGHNGPIVFVKCADGKNRNYSNGDLSKLVSLDGAPKEALKQFGLGVEVTIGDVTLVGKDGTEVFAVGNGTFTVSAPGILAIKDDYRETRGPGFDPSDEDEDEEA